MINPMCEEEFVLFGVGYLYQIHCRKYKCAHSGKGDSGISWLLGVKMLLPLTQIGNFVYSHFQEWGEERGIELIMNPSEE